MEEEDVKESLEDLEKNEEDSDSDPDRLTINMQQYNIRNLETLDWTKDIKIAKLKKYPRAFLKRKHALRYFIQDSHILKIDSTCSSFCQNLLNILDRKHWGLLEPLIDHPKTFTPLLVFLSQNGNSDPILAAFCVKCEMFKTKQSGYSNFRKLLRENVKYDIVRSVVGVMMEERSHGPGDFVPLPSGAKHSSILSETVKLLKDSRRSYAKDNP